MGLLNKVQPLPVGLVVVPTPVAPVVVPTPELDPEPVLLEKPRYKDLDFKRDSRGLIESIRTTDQYGRKVKFDFKRNNMRVLEGISVRSGT